MAQKNIHCKLQVQMMRHTHQLLNPLPPLAQSPALRRFPHSFRGGREVEEEEEEEEKEVL